MSDSATATQQLRLANQDGAGFGASGGLDGLRMQLGEPRTATAAAAATAKPAWRPSPQPDRRRSLTAGLEAEAQAAGHGQARATSRMAPGSARCAADTRDCAAELPPASGLARSPHPSSNDATATAGEESQGMRLRSSARNSPVPAKPAEATEQRTQDGDGNVNAASLAVAAATAQYKHTLSSGSGVEPSPMLLGLPGSGAFHRAGRGVSPSGQSGAPRWHGPHSYPICPTPAARICWPEQLEPFWWWRRSRYNPSHGVSCHRW